MKNRSGQTSTPGEQGFSLIELLIAMVVTIIVGGAVLSLLVEGNRSFRIQPDMTERQQNIRAAMDMIMQDIANAGGGLPLSAQVFKPGLHGATTTINAPSGGHPDELEIMTNDLGLDPVPPVASQVLTTNPFQFLPTTTAFKSLATSPAIPVAVLTNEGPTTFALRLMTYTDGGAGVHARAVFTVLPAGSGGACLATGNNVAAAPPVTAVQYQDVVHYRIFNEMEDPAQPPIPVLQRQSLASGCVWQTVARGIEDMRVTYLSAGTITAAYTGTDACANPITDPACSLPLTEPVTMVAGMLPPAQNDAATVEVQVELAARGGLWTAGAPGSGPMMTKEADGTYAYRGRLVSRGTPRAALSALTDGRWK